MHRKIKEYIDSLISRYKETGDSNAAIEAIRKIKLYKEVYLEISNESIIQIDSTIISSYTNFEILALFGDLLKIKVLPDESFYTKSKVIIP